ncbi:hypothetical protein PIB30_066962 [Stylosanthes scabra]|uniref:Uncharacterized protein n=1 Tax=Stylosanthes scabra TaxID=79078 RepID=A0ABU6VL05_9FABA|nr:hypothetical protein [Stylosanthes scabra]
MNLWLKAVFEPIMVQRDQASDAVEPSTCGIRLGCLTWPKPSGLGRGEAFTHFLTLFMNIDSDEGENYLTYPLTGKENELPFVNSFTNPDPLIQAILDEYWSMILTARLLPVGLPGESNVALKKKVVLYSPQYVARQFGLTQALPAPLLPDTDDQLVHYEVDDLKKLEQLLDRNHQRIEEQFNRQSFPEISRCWQCTQTFTTWWSKQNSIPNFGLPARSRKSYSFGVEEEEYSKSFEGPPFEESFKTLRNLTHSCHCSSSEVTAPSSPEHAPPISATLSRVAAKIMLLLGFPLEDLATDDKLKAELTSAINTLDNELPISEADLIHEFGDFVSGLYSSDLLALVGQKKELNAVVEGWKLLCRRAVDCSEASVQISQVLDQGRKSEQEAVARVKALEIELATAKEGLANIQSAKEDLSGKLKRYEENKASLATATFKAETDMGNARASFNAAEKKVESLDQLRTRLKLSLDRFI